MIKSERMIWAGHVARMGERLGACRVLARNLWEGDNLEDAGVDGRTMLKGIFQKWCRRGRGMDRSGSR